VHLVLAIGDAPPCEVTAFDELAVRTCWVGFAISAAGVSRRAADATTDWAEGDANAACAARTRDSDVEPVRREALLMAPADAVARITDALGADFAAFPAGAAARAM